MSKIISLKKLVDILNTKYYSLNTILVTGCFDILHQAHKDFLKAAKKKGNILIIGLETDERVKQLKGDNRPINHWQTRAGNLIKLPFVDYVFSLPENFNTEKDHLKLLQLIKPKILAISKHDKNLKQKKKLITQTRGQLYIFPYDSKYSTTTLLTNQPLAD